MASLLPSARGAELPPFAVDPELLGLPAAKPVEAPTASPAVKKVEPPAAVQSSAPAAPAAPAPATVASPAVAPAPTPTVAAPASTSPSTAATDAAVASSDTKSVVDKKTTKRNKKPKVSDAPILATPAVNQAAPTAVTATANPVVPATPAPAPVAPPPAAPASPVPSAGVARNMAVFKVDPTLLGLPAEAEVTATAVARPSGTATPTVPAAAVAAQGGAVPVPRRKGELVPGQVMPESAVAANVPSPGSPAAKPSMGLAQNMPAFRVDPSLLDPADRVAAPAAVAIAAAPDAAVAKTKTGPSPKISVVPGVVAGGTYFPPVYAGAAKDRKTVPVYVTADQMEGISGVQAIARGNADLIKADSRLRGDEIIFREKEDEVEARGNVILTREGDEVAGPHLKLKLGDSVGYFESPTFKVEPRLEKVRVNEGGYRMVIEPPTAGYGTASRMDFLGADKYSFDNATYSSCVPGENGQDWFAKVTSLNLDYETNIGEATDATVVFMGVPILYAPSLSFPLNRQRKSGFLAPSWGSTSNGGVEFSVPYYWNIAPEMDATITPRVMAKRGTQWRGEYRYMGQGYTGTFSGEYLPKDNETHLERHAYSYQHVQTQGPFTGSLNINGVSDNTYFTDLATQITTIAQTNLVREGRLTYAGSWWSASTLIQRYQTLQPTAAALVVKPYERLPQVTVSATRPDLPLGLAFNFSGEYVSFSNPDKSQRQGTRTTMYPQISLPLQTAAFYVTPKIGIHNTRYQLDNQTTGLPNGFDRSMPIFSIDSGVVFERETNYFGRGLIQTLEPRLYYLNVPYRDQTNYPVFDTGVADFNFAQIFSENSFSGGDRISNANQTTLALSSRLISPTNGAELAKVMVGQRWYFSDQMVTLPNITPRSGHVADYLGAVTAQMERDTSIDSAIQYNPRDKRLERFNASVRYQPETGRVMNAGYRFSRDLLSQIDLSGQWPLGGGWSGIGRFNYSFKDRSVVENIAGLEYNESCWAVRFVLQHVATATGTSSSAFFVQLQLNGFSSIGTNVSNLLQRSVTGYGRAVDGTEDDPLSTLSK
jgi:LPS-assembly protein